MNGVTTARGIIAANVTAPTQRDESDRVYTSQPRATIRAQAAAPAQKLAVQSFPKSLYANAAK